MMATLARPSVSEQAVRLAWEQDATHAGLKPAAAWLRWYWYRQYNGSPGRRVILAPTRGARRGGGLP